jgi:hypothetical protein
LRQSLTKGKVLAWALGELDHEVIWRYTGTSDDPRVQFLEQGEAGVFRPPGDERDFKHDEVVGVLEVVARQHMDNLEKVSAGIFKMLISASWTTLDTLLRRRSSY